MPVKSVADDLESTISGALAQRPAVSSIVAQAASGGIKNVWVGASEGVLERTREMSLHDPTMFFEMITQADARGRMDRAIAAGECPQQPDEVGNVASRRAILRARVDLLHR